MRVKLDENLPVTLAARLQDLGHDADTVKDEGLSGHPDESVWRAAQQEGRFLVTQDLDSPIRASLRREPIAGSCLFAFRISISGASPTTSRVGSRPRSPSLGLAA